MVMTAKDLAHRIIAVLRSQGYQALLVGGCVRDLLLGREPKDYDVATDARPDQIAALFPRSGLVGAQFGVVLVREGDAVVEVATFRSDLDYIDGRRPEGVRFESSPRADALRRDFTINGLFLEPQSGETLDYVGGADDLRQGVIRAIGDPVQRFKEDHLRLIRAVRFAARLGFGIQDGTMAAMQTMAPSIQRVAPERVRDELVRILSEGGARYGFELLDASGLLVRILPEIAAMKDVAQPPEFHPEGDVWTHTLMMLEGLDHPTPALAMGVLLHDVGKPPTFRVADRIRFDGHVEAGVEIGRDILTRLRFSNDDTEQALALIANHMKFKDVARMKESTLKRFLRLPRFDEHLALHRLDCLNSNGRLDTWKMMRERFAELPPEVLKPAPLITGRDLIAAGHRPGPRFGEILTAVEDAQLEGRITSRDDAMELVRREWTEPTQAQP
ncbi:MAG TPA: CCA tRNA nucleotidyltransferase [Bryobacteraceae bacterium]|jgi:poly(A) polymerase